jgi:hypothetical protein
MLTSKKFWLPVGISLAITVFAVLWGLAAALARGAHARPSSTGLGPLLFPYFELVDRIEGALGVVLVLIAVLGQYPLYGVITGYANVKGKAKFALLGIFISHMVAYMLASRLG